MRKSCLALLFLLIMAAFTVAQDHPHDMQHGSGMQMDSPQKSAPENMELGFVSGTAWQTQTTPEHMWMSRFRAWQLMAHGNVFVTVNSQGGPRGVTKLESMNWLMLMQERKFGGATLQVRQMLSAEALTLPKAGSPQLFQTGETYQGRPLVDRQHPHDVFGELAAKLVVPMGERVAWTLYGGAAGEPALGPVAFMHRNSALEIPAAPLSHHLQDSTHISFGVVTTGLIVGRVKIEGSAFNGREPDEERWNFDFAPMDSFAGRISFNPAKNWTAQYSYGHLRAPEALEETNINRQTASVNYARAMDRGDWATTLVWGRNEKTTERTVQNSYLAESTLNFASRNYAFTRLELVDKDELFLPNAGDEHHSFRIGAYTFGGVRDVVSSERAQLGIGADVTFYSKPAELDAFYGKRPVSFSVFLRFRPGAMKH